MAKQVSEWAAKRAKEIGRYDEGDISGRRWRAIYHKQLAQALDAVREEVARAAYYIPKNTAPARDEKVRIATGEDIVRVIRIIEYVGTRARVEQTVANSIHGSRDVAAKNGTLTIRAATLGSYPEIIERGGDGK